MKRHSLLAIFAIIIGMTVPALAASKTYRLDVGRFDKIKITDNVNVVYSTQKDSIGTAVFTGEEEFADAFIFTNKKGTLLIQVNTDDVNNPNLPTLYVYSDYITAVENSSEFKVTVKHSIPVPSFSAKQIGNGEIEALGINATSVDAQLATGKGVINVSGTCTKATYKMVGTGKIEASGLEAISVQCNILGTGDIYCWPTEELKTRGIGSTNINYKGNPEIKKTGGGHLHPME